MLLNERHESENESQGYEIDAAFLKTEFECPICFEVGLIKKDCEKYKLVSFSLKFTFKEMKPPMRIWQCVDGHPVCEGKEKLRNFVSALQ